MLKLTKTFFSYSLCSLVSSVMALCFFYMLLIMILTATSLNFNLSRIRPLNQNKDIITEGNGSYISDQGIQVTPDEIGSDRSEKADDATYITPLQLWNNASGEMADFENNSEITSGGAIGLPVNYYSLQDSLVLFVAVEFDSFCNVWDPIDSRNLCIAAAGSNFEKNNVKSWSFSSSCLQIDGRNERVNRVVLVVAYSFGLSFGDCGDYRFWL